LLILVIDFSPFLCSSVGLFSPVAVQIRFNVLDHTPQVISVGVKKVFRMF
jgi:hypothetical protein